MEQAEVSFGPGLNLLTGETGSGKSLIVDALGLCVGARASADQVRQGASRALVEASFELGPDRPQGAWPEGLEPCSGATVLGREIARRGGGRIDGRPASPAQLRQAGALLVAIHGQHDQQSLLDPEAQTVLLDGFAQLLPLRAEVALAHATWTAALSQLASLQRQQARGEREAQYLRWQLEELLAADLRAGEDVELSAERGALRHATRLAEQVESAIEAMRGDQGLPRAQDEVRGAADLDPRLEELSGRLDALAEEADGVRGELRHYLEALVVNPGQLELIESRLQQLDSTKRKFGGSIEEAIKERDRLQLEIGGELEAGEAIARAQAQVELGRSELEGLAGRLTQGRRAGAEALTSGVQSELRGLRLDDARLEVRLEPRGQIEAQGAESAAIYFSANPGEAPAPLARVASGGELSRVMLAIKTVSAASDQVSTLVFDEIDAGIGGEAALQVGLRLRRLAGQRQVLVVTHLAQIACFADRHLVVEKQAGADGRNLVRVRHLNSEQERAAELARMMSGGVTAKALDRALELIQEAGAGS